MIIESLDEGDLKQDYHSVNQLLTYINTTFAIRNTLLKFHSLMTIQYCEMALDSVSQINPIDIKKL